MTTLAAYTGPTPVTGYVGYVNLSLCDDGVQITVRSESVDGKGAACHTIPVENARAMLFAAIAALDEARGDPVAKVVAWLRKENGLCDCHARCETECGCGAWDDWKTKPLLEIADALERGEHLK